MKKNKYIGIMMMAVGMLAATSCTDYNDYNTVPEDTQAIANQTLWENIAEDPQLSKFASLARKSNYTGVLSSPSFYTLWAPVDEAISETVYNQLMASDSATIVKQFMHQHITEYNHRISAALDSITIVSLNDKHHPFTQKGFDGFSYNTINIPSTNGVIHKINGLSAFHNNLYENIDVMADCSSLKKHLQKYDEEYLDLRNSVIGPMIDGKQTYLDSVIKKRNNVITKIMRANLDNEDSIYCMLLPNDKAWEGIYNTIYPHYNYIKTMDYMDLSLKTSIGSETEATNAKAKEPAETTGSELQDSVTRQYIVSNLVFSKSNTHNLPLLGKGSFAAGDSAYSTTGKYLTNMQEIINHTLNTSEMSNGMGRVIDSLAFFPWETYNPVIRVTTPAKIMEASRVTEHNIPLEDLIGKRDTLFSKIPKKFHQWLFPAKSRYFSYVAVDSADIEGESGKPEMDFMLKNVRSGTYHIYVITVPAQVEKPKAAVKPYYLEFWLSWTDANNKQRYETLPYKAKNTEISTAKGTDTKTTKFLGDPDRLNVFDLGEFTFPVSYYGLSAYPSLMMTHTKNFTSAYLRRRYDQQMRIAGVFLIPKEYETYWANSVNE